MGVRKILQKNILLKKFFAKNFFPVWTCIKPNLLSKIFPFTWGRGGGSLCENFFSSLNMYQAKSGVKKFSLYWGGVPPKKLLRMSWNTFWFWNFWDLMICGGGGVPLWDTNSQTTGRTDTCHSDQISRSTCRDSVTNNKGVMVTSKSELNSTQNQKQLSDRGDQLLEGFGPIIRHWKTCQNINISPQFFNRGVYVLM